ncbi:MAG: hypothetical protein KIT25_23290 [Enhydrobacter sp.]|nr:MAG: hypothetical protein KIT25_23290 [Enhydrobacter sp.]
MALFDLPNGFARLFGRNVPRLALVLVFSHRSLPPRYLRVKRTTLMHASQAAPGWGPDCFRKRDLSGSLFAAEHTATALRFSTDAPQLTPARRDILERGRRAGKRALQHLLAELVGFVGVTPSWHAREDTVTENVKARRPSILDASRPNSLRTLRSAFQKKLDVSDYADFFDELHGESDRATVILAAAHLDDLLMFRIADSRPFDVSFERDFPWIFRMDGPMSSFSRRMEIACLFSAIDDETYQQLDIIRELRNICAHTRDPVRFTDQAIHNYAIRLFEPPIGFLSKDAARTNLKTAFIIEALLIAVAVSHGSRDEARASVSEAYAMASAELTP